MDELEKMYQSALPQKLTDMKRDTQGLHTRNKYLTDNSIDSVLDQSVVSSDKRKLLIEKKDSGASSQDFEINKLRQMI